MLKIIGLILFILINISLVSAQNTEPWSNICPNSNIIYCQNIGKTAHEGYGHLAGIKLGKILGVCWKVKGSVIGTSPAIPKFGIPEQVRLSPRNAYYYIIDNGSNKPFLRQCREITIK